LKPDAALLVKGRVRHEENARPKVIVSEAQPLEEAFNKKLPALVIRVNLARAENGLIDELQELLAAHPGAHPLIFELTLSGEFETRLRAGKPAGVEVSPSLLASLRSVEGVEAVTVQGKESGGRETAATVSPA